MTRWSITRGTLLLALSLSACGDNGPRLAFSTDHFSYFVEEGVSLPCEGTAHWLERHYAAYSHFFGVSLPAGRRIHYTLVKGLNALRELGCEAGNGCAIGTNVFSTFSLMSHEVVHAVAALSGSPPRLFEEGIAVILGEEWGKAAPGYMPAASASIRAWMESEAFEAEFRSRGFAVYYDAAWFVRFLVNRFGAGAFLELYRSVPENASASVLDMSFLSVFGESRASIVEAWSSQAPPASGAELSLHVVECAEPPLDVLHAERAFGVCGYLNYSFGGSLFRRFTVGDQGAALVTVEGTGQEVLEVHRCAGGDAIGGKVLLNDWGPAATTKPIELLMDVPKGEYFVAISNLRGAPVSVGGTSAVALNPLACGQGGLRFSGPERHLFLVQRGSPRCANASCPMPTLSIEFATDGKVSFQAATNRIGELSLVSLQLCARNCGANDSRSCSGVPVEAARGFLGVVPAGAQAQLAGVFRAGNDFLGFGLRLVPDGFE